MKWYLSVTGHFLINWNLHSVMLSCQCFRGCHTGEQIASTYAELLDHYKIRNKINTVVTDNATNVVAAFAYFEISGPAEEEDSD